MTNTQLKTDNLNVTTERIKSFENHLLKFPQLNIKTTHRFLDGLYSREVFMPKGSFVTSKTHKLENLTIISEGEVLELTANNKVRSLKAPCTMISPPGVKRVLYTLKDTTWTTVHYNPENEKDLTNLEEIIIDPDKELLEKLESVKCLG